MVHALEEVIQEERDRDTVRRVRRREAVLEVVVPDRCGGIRLSPVSWRCELGELLLTEPRDGGRERPRSATEVFDERREVHADGKHQKESVGRSVIGD